MNFGGVRANMFRKKTRNDEKLASGENMAKNGSQIKQELFPADFEKLVERKCRKSAENAYSINKKAKRRKSNMFATHSCWQAPTTTPYRGTPTHCKQRAAPEERPGPVVWALEARAGWRSPSCRLRSAAATARTTAERAASRAAGEGSRLDRRRTRSNPVTKTASEHPRGKGEKVHSLNQSRDYLWLDPRAGT